jgi:septum formation protein
VVGSSNLSGRAIYLPEQLAFISNITMTQLSLVLASSSPFRKELLSRLGLPFETYSPDIDETALANETPQQLVERLAISKAKAVLQQFPTSLIIGSDQVSVLDGHIVGKPKDHQDAVKQLTEASGKEVKLYTGLCLFNAVTGNIQHAVETYKVQFRELHAKQIERYLQRDQPYGCAGSLKAESLGISLLKSLEGNDPNTLIGLPLIRLTDMLLEEQVQLV